MNKFIEEDDGMLKQLRAEDLNLIKRQKQVKFCSCFALMTNALITVIIKLIIIFAVVPYTVNSILNINYIKKIY